MSSRSVPTRSLPPKPHLDQLRNQAKELLHSYRAGEAAAVAEVERFERNPDPAQFALADAQRVLARAYGFSSWARLKQHVEGVNVEAFCAAAAAGDVATVRKLAQARPDLVNSERGGEFGEQTALHFAVLNRDANMTRALMELGSDARRGVWPHRDATAAGTIASERGYDEIVAIIEQAEERRRKVLSVPGATINAKTDQIQQAILQDRCDEAIRILKGDLSLVGACNVERGLNDIDGRRLAQGATPLHVAAWKHNPTMVAWLLERQASALVQDVEGMTPLDYAALVAGWSPHGRVCAFMENARKAPALFDETVELLRSRGAELTPRAAAAIGDQQAVLRMHREGRLKNEIESARGGLLAIAVRVDRIDMVSLLLDLGLDPDESVTAAGGAFRSWGMPLWFASMCGRHEIAELLLARGADVDAIVYACGDPLCMAEDEQMAELLRKHGARLTVERVTDRKTAQEILDGITPAYSLNVAEPTLTDLAEQMLWAAGSRDPEIVRLCLPYMKRRRDDPWWNYVLMHATLPDSFQLVLVHGVDPDVAADGGYTMLHHLATKNIDAQNRVRLATMLLDAGASLSKRDSLLKGTPLGWACRWGHRDLVELYLQRGADVREPDAEAWATPLAWASKAGHREIAERLRTQGAGI